MGLLGKLFGNKDKGRREPHSTEFEEEAADTRPDISARHAPRREVVQVVLRDTMRRHGIPSDWVEARILSVMSTSRGSGMHVLLVVRHGDERLAPYVHAFQDSFMQELVRLEPKATDWIFSVSWQFEGKGPHGRHPAMPDPATWVPGQAGAVPGAQASAATAGEQEDDELEEDLKALFAIRDAALRPPGDRDHPDFEPTRPGIGEEDQARSRRRH